MILEILVQDMIRKVGVILLHLFTDRPYARHVHHPTQLWVIPIIIIIDILVHRILRIHYCHRRVVPHILVTCIQSHACEEVQAVVHPWMGLHGTNLITLNARHLASLLQFPLTRMCHRMDRYWSENENFSNDSMHLHLAVEPCQFLLF